MEVTDNEIAQAEQRMQAARAQGYAVSATYNPTRDRIVVRLDNDFEFSFAPKQAEGLEAGDEDTLTEIEISPTGLGLHWPRLDADLYLPALLEGIFGSRAWMARSLGQTGGEVRSPAKATAARANGRKGGRPRVKG